MPPVGFEPTIPASVRPQTHALECAATGIGMKFKIPRLNIPLLGSIIKNCLNGENEFVFISSTKSAAHFSASLFLPPGAAASFAAPLDMPLFL
jgi:hypothetical protein